MENILKNTVDCMKSMTISKKYDSQMTFSSGNTDSSPLTLTMKGDISLNGIQIAAMLAAIGVFCISCAVVKKLKN